MIAAERVASAASALRAAGSPTIFKKIDSTLRGPIGAELAALSTAFGNARVTVAPAYPALGRIVRHGRLYIDGVPLHQTPLAADARWPISDSDIRSVLPSEASWVSIRDAETDADLNAIAEDSLGTILAGSGGLARAWVRSLPEGSGADLPALRRPQRVLLICGSHHPVSLDQARLAEAAGIFSVIAPRRLADPELVSRIVATQSLDAIHRIQPDTLIFFGGETAARILWALGIEELHPRGEVLPGIPECVATSGGTGIRVVTKAGAFGPPGVVDEILKRLQ
jgi:uncharacterized protein YgbK (DUF1537 family)